MHGILVKAYDIVLWSVFALSIRKTSEIFSCKANPTRVRRSSCGILVGQRLSHLRKRHSLIRLRSRTTSDLDAIFRCAKQIFLRGESCMVSARAHGQYLEKRPRKTSQHNPDGYSSVGQSIRVVELCVQTIVSVRSAFISVVA